MNNPCGKVWLLWFRDVSRKAINHCWNQDASKRIWKGRDCAMWHPWGERVHYNGWLVRPGWQGGCVGIQHLSCWGDQNANAAGLSFGLVLNKNLSTLQHISCASFESASCSEKCIKTTCPWAWWLRLEELYSGVRKAEELLPQFQKSLVRNSANRHETSWYMASDGPDFP